MIVWLLDLQLLCNQSPSQLMLWVRISIRARCTKLCDKVCQKLPTGRWFSPIPPVFSTYKTDRHDITKISLKMALSTINQTIHYLKLYRLHIAMIEIRTPMDAIITIHKNTTTTTHNKLPYASSYWTLTFTFKELGILLEYTFLREPSWP